VQEELPECDDWTAVVISPVILRIVAIVSGNIFLGPDMCRQEEYLNIAILFTMDLAMASAEIKRWPSWFRSIGAYLTPQVAKVSEHRRKMTEFLAPAIEERRLAMRNGDEVPDDTFQWMLEKATNHGVTDTGHLSDMILLLIFAAIHTTTLTATNV
jgi:choline dehydrogenase